MMKRNISILNLPFQKRKQKIATTNDIEMFSLLMRKYQYTFFFSNIKFHHRFFLKSHNSFTSISHFYTHIHSKTGNSAQSPIFKFFFTHPPLWNKQVLKEEKSETLNKSTTYKISILDKKKNTDSRFSDKKNYILNDTTASATSFLHTRMPGASLFHRTESDKVSEKSMNNSSYRLITWPVIQNVDRKNTVHYVKVPKIEKVSILQTSDFSAKNSNIKISANKAFYDKTIPIKYAIVPPKRQHDSFILKHIRQILIGSKNFSHYAKSLNKSIPHANGEKDTSSVNVTMAAVVPGNLPGLHYINKQKVTRKRKSLRISESLLTAYLERKVTKQTTKVNHISRNFQLLKTMHKGTSSLIPNNKDHSIDLTYYDQESAKNSVSPDQKEVSIMQQKTIPAADQTESFMTRKEINQADLHGLADRVYDLIIEKAKRERTMRGR